MKSKLERYLARLQDTILSRRSLEVEELEITDRSDQPERTSEFHARLRFWDNSLLEVEEALTTERHLIIKVYYSYHYQRADGSLILRYDNVPHHPELPTHPHHKHIGERVVAAQAPDLSEVLREIEQIISA
jgi:hypothetical protein